MYRVIAFHHTQGHTTVGRTPLDKGSARRRDLYLTTQKHTTHKTNIHAPGGIFFFLSVLYLYWFVLFVLSLPFILTVKHTHKRQTSMPPVGFEPAIPAGERLQTLALDRSTTWAL
jgi:hypothetical protein